MKVVILAGGEGTRLFPMSRKKHPKHLLNVFSTKTLLENTVDRFLGIVETKDMIIVTNKSNEDAIKNLFDNDILSEINIVSEPSARNTAPAVLYALKYMIKNNFLSEDEVVIVTPSDNYIELDIEFKNTVKKCSDIVNKDKIVTIGVEPTSPETGYGYIEAIQPILNGYLVESFIEKPEKDVSTKIFDSGRHYWNSGIYCFTKRVLLNEFELCNPEIVKYFNKNTFEQMQNNYSQLKSESIDYALSEKSRNLAMVKLTCKWSDVGSWDAVYNNLQKDDFGNVSKGDCNIVDCKNSMAVSNSRLLVLAGLDDIIAVETDDVVLITKKGETQNVKKIVEFLCDRKETLQGKTCTRVWGSYTILIESPGYKVKKITVLPGKSLSYQRHKCRSEHWTIVKGKATVVFENKITRMYLENESIYVEKQRAHQLINKEDSNLEVIEVQIGDYLEEDDIERI